MYLSDDVQETLRQLNKLSQQEVIKKQGDLYVAVNVLTGNSRIMSEEHQLIESLDASNRQKNKQILKG